jgi:hypothetical protein
MISTDISTMMKFRLINTPSRPVIKSTALTAIYALKGTIDLVDCERGIVKRVGRSCSLRRTPYLSRVSVIGLGVFASTIAPMMAPKRNTPTISNCNR